MVYILASLDYYTRGLNWSTPTVGRPKTNDVTVSLDVLREMRRLFGTIRNAWWHMEPVMTYERFQRAMQHLTITQEEADQIWQVWHDWQKEYLAPRYRYKGHSLTLDPTNQQRLLSLIEDDDHSLD